MAKKKTTYTGAMVLGLHDAIVSQTGIIVGLTATLADNHMIILTSIIAATAAGLSMAASNYLAEKADGRPHALLSGLYTGIMYIFTSALLIAPFMFIANKFWALGCTFAFAVFWIFLFNYLVARAQNKSFLHRFLEMLFICIGVSVIAFGISTVTEHLMGVDL